MKQRSNILVLAVSSLIILSVVMTSEWMLNKKNVWDELAIDLPSDPDATIQFVNKEAKDLSDPELNNLARTIIETRDILFSQKMVDALIYNSKSPHAEKLAVYMAEQGFILKNDMVLANRAGLEYKIGRFVPKNYEKATIILRSKILSNLPISKFYLAEVLLDEKNPNKNQPEAKALLEEASSAGIAAAKSKLKEIM